MKLIKSKNLLIGLSACFIGFSSGSFAAQTAPFTPEQQQAIQKIVHDYLVSQPQILMEVATALQKQQQAQMQEMQNKVVPALKQPLFGGTESPVLGNPAAKVTLVEFFDYECPHCKDMAPKVQDIMNHNANLHVIFKPLPIFGSVSVFAAKAALASQKQGKFAVFHEALMKIPNTLTQDLVLKIAQQVGVNIQQLQTDMNSPAIAQEIQQNNMLAKSLKLTGTPAFVIAQVQYDNKDHQVSGVKSAVLIPGAVSENMLVEAIGDVNNAK